MSEGLRDRRVGFIGCGAMASALGGGLVAAGLSPAQMTGADPDEGCRATFAERVGAATTVDNAQLVADSDLVVLAVKPGIVTTVLSALASEPDLTRPLWISIAAGVPIQGIESHLPAGARVVRAMPNTPALVRDAATALVASHRRTPSTRRR